MINFKSTTSKQIEIVEIQCIKRISKLKFVVDIARDIGNNINFVSDKVENNFIQKTEAYYKLKQLVEKWLRIKSDAVYELGKTGIISICTSGINTSNEESHLIIVDSKVLQNKFKATWLKNSVSFDNYIDAIIIKELALIEYGMPDIGSSYIEFVQDDLLKSVFDVVETVRCLYKLNVEKPEFCNHIAIYLQSIKFEFPTSLVMGMLISKGFDKVTQEKYLSAMRFDWETFEVYIKYGLIPKKYNEQFFSSVFLLAIGAKRGDINDSIRASSIIKNLLLYDVLLEQNKNYVKRACKDGSSIKESPYFEIKNSMFSKATQVKQDKKIVPMLKKYKNELIEFVDEDSKDVAKQMFSKESIERLDKTINIGKEKAEIKPVRSQFFKDVIRENKAEINALRNMFLKLFTKYSDKYAKDGELNLQRQQSAYINSITREEGYDYLYKVMNHVDSDVVLLRDVSSSVGNDSLSFAKQCIIFLSALENIPGIRTAQIDFSSIAKVNKIFNDTMDMSYIVPAANGGTSIEPAYSELLKMDIKGKNNILIIITDGEYNTGQASFGYEKELALKGFKIIRLGILGHKGNNVISVPKLSDLPNIIYNEIVKGGFLC